MEKTILEDKNIELHLAEMPKHSLEMMDGDSSEVSLRDKYQCSRLILLLPKGAENLTGSNAVIGGASGDWELPALVAQSALLTCIPAWMSSVAAEGTAQGQGGGAAPPAGYAFALQGSQ
ncbi:MAG TPA: hypothetical protein PKW57_08815 [Anaerolineaceae bacterium]|jgi:hypothetical protein|nr:hypothetical protein [Anaerolineaceae bacterium]HPS33591.1 hypothetical protein [Anaerolineaceae bacterium]